MLYVDDEPELLEIAKLFLESSGGFLIDTQLSAREGLDALQNQAYDAVVADFQMPVMDGIEFLKRVRSEFGNIPFILFTGRGREEVVIDAINNGADYYLQKGDDLKAQFTELAHKIRLAVQQRRAEASIRDHERRESDILNFLPDATFAIDRNGVVIAWNRAMERMTGVEASAILGKGNFEYSIPFYHERRQILIDLVLHDNPATVVRYPFITRDGKTLFSEITTPYLNNGRGAALWFTASPLYDIQGTIVGAIESIREITERKRVLDALHKSEQQYRIMVEDQSEFISRFLPNGNLVFVNEAYCRYFGLKRDEVLGHRFRPKIPAEDQERVRHFFASLTPDHPVDIIEHRIIMPCGDISWQRWSDRAIFDPSGTLIEYQSVGWDITERKRAEDALRQVNRQLNLLTSITRHDIRNQIQVILGYLALAEMKFNDPALSDYIRKIASATKAIQSLIADSQVYQKVGQGAPVWQDLGNLLNTAERGIIPGQVTLKNDLPACTEVFADSMLEKVFFNLLDNSIRHGQRVTEIRVSSCLAGKDLIVVWEDNGIGIAAEEKERIFERGFGKNTGLGLFLVRDILSLTGITIKENGTAGNGVRFEITVPKGGYRFSKNQQV